MNVEIESESTLTFGKAGEVVGALHLGKRLSEQLHLELLASLRLFHKCELPLLSVVYFPGQSFRNKTLKSNESEEINGIKHYWSFVACCWKLYTPWILIKL